MNSSNQKVPVISADDWQQIDTVLLDMDGTLLDKYFDDFFWEHYVPEVYAEKNNISVDDSRKELLGRYKKIEGTLEWADLDFWSHELDLDIPAMKMRIDHLINVHPYVIDFLRFCRRIGKKLYLVTNAHSKTLAIKMRKTVIGDFFDRIICAEEVGMAKEDPAFWQGLEEMLGFDRSTTLLADDNEQVLESAEQYGIGVLIYVARPSTREPVSYSERYPSIIFFKELMGRQ